MIQSSETVDSIRSAVADAVQVAIAHNFDPTNANWQEFLPPDVRQEIVNNNYGEESEDYFEGIYRSYVDSKSKEEQIRNYTENLTRGKCVIKSEQAADFIIEKYGDLFDKVCILDVEFDPSSRIYKHHAYLILKDVTGKWWAASPANYNNQDSNENMHTIYEAESAEELIAKINENGIYIPATETLIQRLQEAKKPKRRFDAKGSNFDKTWVFVKPNTGDDEVQYTIDSAEGISEDFWETSGFF